MSKLNSRCEMILWATLIVTLISAAFLVLV